MSHFRTLTAVVEIHDESELRYPGYASERAQRALEAEGFCSVRVRNAPNLNGAMPADHPEDETR